MDYVERQEIQRRGFFRDLNRMPLTQIQAMLDSVNFLSPAERTRIERARDNLLDNRKVQVNQWLEDEFRTFRVKAERAQADADDIKDDLDALIAKAEAGQMDAAEFQRQYERLEHRMNNVRRNVDAFSSGVEAIRQKEEDPEAWMQSLERKFPAIRQGVFSSGPPSPSGDPEAVSWTRST